MKDVKKVLDENGIEFWLDWGTLLGAVREKKIIEWDDDVDISTFSKNWKEVNSMISEFEKKGFKLADKSEVEFGNGFFHRSVTLERFGYDVDIYFYELKNDTYFSLMLHINSPILKTLNLLNYLFLEREKIKNESLFWDIANKIKNCLFFISKKKKKKISYKIERLMKKFYDISLTVTPKKYFEKLENINFYGEEFKVPSNKEDYLKNKYGGNWRTPNENFNKGNLVGWGGIIKLY